MSADVVGYTAMMAADTPGTMSSLFAYFRQIEIVARRFRGRVVDATGDNVLVEFPSEEAAFSCAIELQRVFADLRRAPSVLSMHFRIGLHSGPAIAYRGRLYGDCVNVAARLQSAAEPDGIWMSERVAERASAYGSRAIDELGPRQYKNLPYAVATYRLCL
jgi:adenylate cyclase